MRLLLWTVALLLCIGAEGARAADEDALALADTAALEPEKTSDWRIVAEAAAGGAKQRLGTPSIDGQRLSLAIALDKTLAPRWRAVFANRLDWRWQTQEPTETKVNTLKEAYLSHAWSDTGIVDAGRINVRNGVATGFNPTDFFRDGALRSIVSVSPASLRENRLGSVMLRAQHLWPGGAVTALYSPRLESARSDDPFSLDLGATNHENRLLLTWSQRITERLAPQFLLYKSDQLPLQMGANLSTLWGQATVAYVEWAGGRSPSLSAQALADAGDTSFTQRVASGLTYTGFGKTSLTLEYQYNGAALSQDGWSALRAGAPDRYLRYRLLAQSRQDPPTREAWFVYASWQDAGIPQLDLAALARHSMADTSRLVWVEARYHWGRSDIAFQWQRHLGTAGTEYGALPQSRSWQFILSRFF